MDGGSNGESNGEMDVGSDGGSNVERNGESDVESEDIQ